MGRKTQHQKEIHQRVHARPCQLTPVFLIMGEGRGAFTETVLVPSTGGVPWIVGSAVDSLRATPA